MAVKLNAETQKDHLCVPVQMDLSLAGMVEHVKVCRTYSPRVCVLLPIFPTLSLSLPNLLIFQPCFQMKMNAWQGQITVFKSV